MNILKITNLTDEPEKMLYNNIENAIREVETEEEIELTKEQKEECHDYIDSLIELFEEEGKVSDLGSFVDNLLINHDYVETVKEVIA